jgi:hypothetical protein
VVEVHALGLNLVQIEELKDELVWSKNLILEISTSKLGYKSMYVSDNIENDQWQWKGKFFKRGTNSSQAYVYNVKRKKKI